MRGVGGLHLGAGGSVRAQARAGYDKQPENKPFHY